MNYRDRVMELSLGWSAAELRCMAAEMASEADQEIARLREALERIQDNPPQPTSVSQGVWYCWWSELAIARGEQARAALAQVAEVGNG